MDNVSNRDRRHRAHVALIAAVLAVGSMLGAPVAHVTTPAVALAAGSFTDPYFREFNVFAGLTKPTTVRFASDGRAFVAEKGGVVKAFDSVADTTATTVVDLRADVMDFWDRGLLGLAIDPGFLAGRPFLYLYFAYDAPPGFVAPYWNDNCLNPPGATLDGCVVTSHLERIQVNPATNAAVPGTRLLLIDDWCQQFPSHSGGGLAFGPDGKLYLSAGDGASFSTTDYGQLGGTVPNPANPVTPVNPCGDPTTLLTPDPITGNPVTDVPTAEGGTLRSQDVRTGADPAGLDGSLIRIDPDTGAAAPGNPLAGSADANERRMLAHGFRNPFRWTFRPGTSEIYLGDVGNQTWEEIERVALPAGPLTRTTMPNFGWPCYEGVARSSYQTLGLNLCTTLYAQGASAVTAPLYQYSHVDTRSPTGPCFVPGANGAMSSSVTGVAFYEGATPGSAPYPTRYDGALFFADYSRNCLAVLLPGADGAPDAATMETVATGVGHPVDLLTGPGGDLYYVDITGGRVVRVRHLAQPIASATATPAVSLAPVTVTLDASASSDPDPTSTLTAWNWDLDHDGAFDGPSDKSGQVVTWDIATPGVYPITLQVVNSNGLTDTLELSVDAGNTPPVPEILLPAGSLTWAVGDTIGFSGGATDVEEGALPASALSWDIVMMHCPADCHEHVIQTFEGVASGSFEAPDHEYPSHLEIRLTATDSHGSTGTTSVDLQPRTSVIHADTVPSGGPLFIAGSNRPSPSDTTVIRGGLVTVSAPVTATIAGKAYRFGSWSDGQARTHDTTASTDIDLAATYVADAPDSCSAASSNSPLSSWISERTSGNGDADWFRFQLTSTRRVVITLGDLPVDGRLELYSTCSTRLATIDNPGTRFEEYTRTLAAGNYRVRVTAPGNASSDQPYVVRFRSMASGLPVKSYRTTVTGSQTRIVGEVLNNTGSTRGPITVTATLRNRNGAVVARLTGSGFARRTSVGAVTSFAISGPTKAWTSVRISTTSVAAASAPSLSLATFAATANPNGTVTEHGTIRNSGTRTARSVAIARVWYGRRGEVLDRGVVLTTPSTLVRGASAPFTLLRPALPTAERWVTQLRGLF